MEQQADGQDGRGADTKPAAWYPDPSGTETGRFRWWDGAQWTQAVTTTLWAPEPRDAKPYSAGTPTADDGPKRTAPSEAIGIPADYEIDDLDDTPNRLRLIVGIVAVAAVAGVVIGLAVWLTGGSDTPVAASDRSGGAGNAAAETGSGDDDGSPDGEGGADAESEAGRTDDEAGEDDGQGRAEGKDTGRDREREHNRDDDPGDPVEGWPLPEPLPGEWYVADWSADVVPHGHVEHFVTEPEFNGTDSWRSIIVTGEIPEEVEPDEDPAITAEAVVDWWSGLAYGPDNRPPSTPLGNRRLTVADRPAFAFDVEQGPYELDGLESTRSTVRVIIIDLGPERRPGLHLATVPDTHPELWTDIDESIASTTLHTP